MKHNYEIDFISNPIRGFQEPLQLPNLNIITSSPVIDKKKTIQILDDSPSTTTFIIKHILKSQFNIQKMIWTEQDYLNTFMDLDIIPQKKYCSKNHLLSIKNNNILPVFLTNVLIKNRNYFKQYIK